MTELNGLHELIFGKDGFHKNYEHPLLLKYWKDKIDDLIEKSRERNLTSRHYFQYLKIESNNSILTRYVNDDYLKSISNSQRCLYYRTAIQEECSVILQNISNSVRLGNSDFIEKIVKSLRWYVFEINNLLSYYYESYSGSLEYLRFISDLDPYDPVDEKVEYTNFLTALYFRDCIINLIHYIDLVTGEHKSNAKDEYINQTLLDIDIYDDSPYRLYRKYFQLHLKFLNIKSLPNYYDSLKEIYLRLFDNSKYGKVHSDLEDVLKDIRIIENILYMARFENDLINSNSTNVLFINEKYDPREKSFEEQTIFEELYTNALRKIEIQILPIQRLNEIDRIIQEIEDLIKHHVNDKDISFPISIPRKIIKYLALYSDTIKANPLIELKELDKARIKPIETNISVSQLALLFKILEENSIIKSNAKTDLYKTITKSFLSKSVTGNSISEKSFQNNFNDPDKGAYKFWAAKFEAFQKECKKYI